VNGLYDAAQEVQTFLHGRGWRFCIIGGIALARWGQPRTTQDVDVTLLTGFGAEEDYARDLLEHFEARREEALAFALTNRVLLLRASNGVPIDLSFAGFPYEEELIGRASAFKFTPDTELDTCSAEDLIVLKAFASRPLDWQDVEGVAIRQAGKLDWEQVETELAPLCELKGEPEILDRLRRLREQVSG